MKIDLSQHEKQQLESRHKSERDGRVRDRIKAVLLHDEGWTQVEIAQALRIRSETVHDHLEEFKRLKKLTPLNGGSVSQLTIAQTHELIAHLEQHTYTKVSDICCHVESTYRVTYTVSGMTKWLHRHHFSYKKTKETPAKADPVQQEAFLKSYSTLLNTLP